LVNVEQGNPCEEIVGRAAMAQGVKNIPDFARADADQGGAECLS